MAFDVEAARKSGYSDAEIAGFLAQQNNMDLDAAKKAGYRDHEVISHFTGTEVRPADPEFMASPTSNVSPENDPSKMAGMGTQAVASLPTDMKARAGYFAKQRFPDDPNAVSRYGVQDGRLFYTDDAGKMYYEEPKLSVSPTEAAKYVASSAGPALPFAGSIAGGVATVPGGGVPGAALGAAAGDEMRQLLAAGLVGDTGFNPMQTAKEAGGAAFGQGLGLGFGKYLNRGVPRDINLLDNPEVQVGISKLQSDAEKLGISLTPAETTNLRSLRAQQNYLGDSPRSADVMSDFYTRRNTLEVPQAVNDMLAKVSPVESVEVGAKNLQQGAADTIKAQMAERQSAAKPLYDASREAPVPAASYQQLMKDPFLAKQIRSVKADPKYQSDISDLFPKSGKTIETGILDADGNALTRSTSPVEAKIGYLDVVKRRIDGMIETAKTAGNRNDVRIYTKAKEKLTKALDDASPEYTQARSIFEEGSPAVTALTKGEVGLASKAKETGLDRIPKIIFESGSDAVKANRAAYLKAGKEQEWNDGLRSYLQSNFDKASKEFKTGNVNPGASFRASVFGTAKQKAAMQNAMSSEQWAGFNRLMDVLEASGRVTQGGSRTYFAGQMGKEMEAEAMGISGKAAQNILDAPGIPGRLGGWVKALKTGKYTEDLAKIITSPKAMEELKALKYYKPNSIKAMAVVSQVLTQYGLDEAGDPADVAPGDFGGGNDNQKIAQ